MKEEEFLIFNADVVNNGREIAYEVKMLCEEVCAVGKLGAASFFVDGNFLSDFAESMDFRNEFRR
jgi:hypothetical protein